MKQIILRGLRKDEMIAISIVLALSLALFEGFMIHVLIENWHIPSERLFGLLIILLITLFFGLLMVWFICSFRKYICVTEDSVVLMSGSKAIKTIPKDQIIAYGVLASMKSIFPASPFSAMQLSVKFPQLRRNTGTGESESIGKSNWKN